MREPRFYTYRDGTLAAWHFGTVDRPVRLVFIHANGFNGLTYRTILQPLAVQYGIQCVALDMRGHGCTQLTVPTRGLQNWHIFRDDIIHFFESAITQPVVLAGHSFGAVSAILAAPALQDKIGAYVGFDPVMIPWFMRQWSRIRAGRALMAHLIPVARAAGQRRAVFASKEQAFAHYKGRGAFKRVSDRVLSDYLHAGLLPRSDSGMHLACQPLWEQAIFTAQAHNFLKSVPFLPVHSHIISAGYSAVSTAVLRARVAKVLTGGRIEFRSDFKHLFPLHHPNFARRALADAIEVCP